MSGESTHHQQQQRQQQQAPLSPSSPSSPPHPATTADLRHITSNPSLLSTSPPRHHLAALTPNSSRGGSRSPASMPSSPTSIHSSSSAIFERDIEALPSASPLPHHAPNPHRTPRSKGTEQISHAVPNVLAEAATALAASTDGDISVIAPANLGSRSPRRSPSPSPPSRKPSLHPSPVSSPPSPPAALPDHPSHHSAKRLSFISYSDLLASTPISALPLSSFTTPHSTAPPPHLPAVSAASQASSPSRPLSQIAPPSRPLSTYSISTGISGRLIEDIGKRLKDDIGGEWEREGFGKGLEERLEEMVGSA